MSFSDLLPPFEQRGMDLSLDRMQRALKTLGHPCGSVPAVQVVGTNGKGSIASFVHSGLVHAGISTGLTTSPHLVDWTERIRVGSTQISSQELRQHLEKLQPLARTEALTPFELLITAALVHFDQANLEWLVLEAGLGGRLDATTAHSNRPLLAVASIGLDHCEHLGSSLTAVAREKAAAITPGATVISAHQGSEVAAVLQQACEQTGAQLCWVDPLDSSWQLGLSGHLQRSNAAVAKAVLEQIRNLGWTITDTTIREGLAAAHWPGRLQTMHWRGKDVLIDGAHNPPAAEALALERQHWPHQANGVTWILGIQAHKQAPTMLKTLLKPQDQAWIVPVPGHRSWTRTQLLNENPGWTLQLHALPDSDPAHTKSEAVAEVLTLLEQQGWPAAAPVIAGSLYLIGHLLEQKRLLPGTVAL
jgi:dihydrofolate synthase/folylpolyglutamate synthase